VLYPAVESTDDVLIKTKSLNVSSLICREVIGKVLETWLISQLIDFAMLKDFSDLSSSCPVKR
jgi:hypothetical protein